MAIEKKNAWEKYPQGPEREKLFAFAEDYRRFISGCKTERECTAAVYADATGHGFVDLDELIETRSEERRVGKECRSRWSPYH